MRTTAFCAAALLTACDAITFSSQDITEAKEAVGLLLNDPETAQFSDLTAKDGRVCGLVNAKNLVGAYTGLNGFIVDQGVATIGDGSPEFFDRFLRLCPDPAKSKFMSLDLAQSKQRLDAAVKALNNYAPNQ